MNKKLILALIAAAVVMRFIPHPWNFSPLTALALFAGCQLKSRTGILALLGVLFASDLVLGFHSLIPITWGCFLLILLLGRTIKPESFSGGIFLKSLAGSTLFYLITNLGVFAATSLYPKSIAGFWECYWMALPFFRNALVGDLAYTFALFGAYHLATKRVLVKVAKN